MAYTRIRRTNNFWHQKLRESNVTLQEMSELIGCSYKYTVAYFTGFVHPTDNTIITICDLLNVPFDFGKKKFDEIYEAWGKAHKSYVKVGNTYKKVSEDAHKTIDVGFWRHKVDGSDITGKELATIIDKPYSTTNAYLSGFILPDKETVKKICIQFNVDFDRGYQEFLKAHDRWGIAHADTYVKQGNSYKAIPISKRDEDTATETPVTPVIKDIPVEPTPVIETIDVPTPIPDYLVQLIYGKLSCDDFLKAKDLTTLDELLEFVYGKVDYDTFMAML